MNKRVLSFLLVLVMVLSMLPVLDLTAVQVSAEEVQATEVSLTLKPAKLHSDENHQIAVDVQLSSTTEFALGSLQFAVKPADGITAAMDIAATGLAGVTADVDQDDPAKTNVVYVTDGENLVTVGTTPVTVGTLTLTGTAPFGYSDEMLTIDTEIVGVSQSDTTYPLNVVASCGYTKGGHGTEEWIAWDSADDITAAKIEDGGHYYLAADNLTISSQLQIAKDVNFTVCLNGMTLNGPANARCFRLSCGAHMTLCDCTASGEGDSYTAGKITSAVGQYGTIVGLFADNSNPAEGFVLEDGILEGTMTSNTKVGGAIAIGTSAAKVTVNGGKITGFVASAGGAISAELGDIEINGGIFTNNTATGDNGGGALYIANGTTEINSGTFSGNTATKNGGALCIKGGNVTVNGGTYSGNTAKQYGSAIYSNGVTVNVKNATITENTTTSQGAVCVYGGVVNISDTQITDNTCTADGGSGIYGQSGATITLTDVTVTGNKCTGGGLGGVYIAATSTSLIVSGVTVIDNNTLKDGAEQNVYFAGQYGSSYKSLLYVNELTEGSNISVTTTDDRNAAKKVVQIAAGGSQTEWNGNWVTYTQNADSEIVWSDTDGCFVFDTHAHADFDGVTWQKWGDSADELTKLPTTTGYYYLVADITAYTEMKTEDLDVVICLNGHTISAKANNIGVPQRIFRISNGAEVTVCDCTAEWKTEVNETTGEQEEVYYGGKLIPGSGLKGGVALLYKDSTDTADDPAFIMKDAVIDGTGVTNPNMGAALMIEAATNGKIALTDVVVQNCTTDKNGGAIYLLTGSCEVTRGAFIGNKTTAVTAAVKRGETTHTNNLGCGGAIYTYTAGVTINGTKFEGNNAGAGSAIYSHQATVTIENGATFTENDALINAAIFGLGGTLNVTDATFTGNINRAAGCSAVYGQSGTKVNLTDCTITNNVGKGSGSYGALWIAGTSTPLTVSGKTVIDDNYMLDGTERNVYYAGAASGSAYLYVNGLAAGSRISVYTNAGTRADANAVVKKSTATGAAQTTWDPSWVKYENTGASVLLDTLDADAGTITFTFGHKHADDAEGTIWTAWDGTGTPSGNVYLTKDVTLNSRWNLTGTQNVTLCLNGYSLKRNVATSASGGQILSLTADAMLTVCDCTAHYTGTGEEEVYHAGKLTGGGTGAIMMHSGCTTATFTLKSGKITGNNTLDQGGAVVIQGTGRFILEGGEVSDNHADPDNNQKNGGAFYVSSTHAEGAFVMTGGKIFNNSTAGNGGAIYAYKGIVKVQGGQILDNTAGCNGGAIYHSNGTATVSNTTISGNTATGNGGAIWTNGGSVTIDQNTELSGNTAAQGGAIFSNAQAAAVTLDIDDAKINGNESTSHGSAIRVNYDSTKKFVTSLTVDDTEISNNKMTGNSGYGTVILAAGAPAFTNVTMTGNYAVQGAAFRIESGARLTLTDCDIQNNESGTSGAVWLYNKNSYLNVKGDTVIANNQSNGREQNVYLSRQGETDTGFIALSELGASAKVGVTAQYKDGTVGSVKVATKDATYADGKLFSDNELRSLEISGGDINLTRPQIANMIHADKTVTPYYELNKATAALTETDILQLVHDVPEDDVTNHLRNLTGTVTLDLNGYDVLSQITGTAATLQLIDSQTNDYSVKDAEGNLTGYGKIASIAEDVIVSQWHKVGGKYYLVLDLEDGISAHRVYSSVTAKTLRTNSTGIGFQARFATNEVAREKITGFGMNLVVKDGETVKGTVPLDVMALSDRKLDSAGTPLVFAIKDIIKNTDAVIEADSANEATLIAENNTYANYTIAGTPFIKLSESESYNGTSSTVTFKDMVQTADENFANYNETQQTAFRTMCGKFSQTMGNWNLDILSQ